jgi:class 3 adenylate cyclase
LASEWTLERMLEAHPWPADAVGRRLEYLWRFDLSCSVASLWSLIIDTSRLNRALGLSELSFREHDGAVHGKSRTGGVRHEWIELPWDWVAHRYVVAERIYSRGLSRRVRVIYRFEPHDGGVSFYVYFGWLTHGWLSRLVLQLGVWAIRGRLEALLEELAAHQGEQQPAAFVASSDTMAEVGRRRIDAARRELVERGHDDALIDHLFALVTRGDSADVSRMQPRKLAHLWQRAERDMLRLFLHATRAGVLEMSWDVICPHCRGVRAELKNLGQIPASGDCQICEIEFGTGGANAIEIAFHIHPSVREVPKQLFCSAQAHGKRHVVLQQQLEPGETRRVETALAGGRYRTRLQGSFAVGFLDLSDDATEQVGHWRQSDEPRDVSLSCNPTLELTNDADESRIFVVEDVNWADEALRPAHLFSFQEFRDLFSEEYLAADVQLSVGEQTILFTDIVGSTGLYIDRGDPEAFVEVRKHFAEVYHIIDAHDGAVVKTIGDAAMAAFSDTLRALTAAREMHRTFHEGRTDSPVRLRVSVNTGVCIAVNLNSQIDYFGNTVNVAAKLQALAGAGEVSMSEHTYRAPGVADFLAASGDTLDAVDFELKALGGCMRAYRWRCDDAETRGGD